MGGFVAVLYGCVVYLLFLGTFLYAVAFVGNLPVPKTIDSGDAGPLVPALIIDMLLLALFAIQHSVMARPGFKRWCHIRSSDQPLYCSRAWCFCCSTGSGSRYRRRCGQ
jgi:protein-S-isoprenylcysteine O-methyltransferase Ste14